VYWIEEASQTKPETVAIMDWLDPNEEKELQEEIEADPGKAELNVLGEWRMCVDYWALNTWTVWNTYPLLRIQDLIDLVGSAKIVSKIDLLLGYWQVQVGEASILKTAFNTRFGKYKFIAMPMGLTNAPAIFQTMMNSIL
jgi:hypothetical protein